MTRRSSAISSTDCMTATGVVVAAERGHVEIEFAAPVGCRGCNGTCLWRRLPAATRATFATALPLKCGDSVSLSLPDRFLLAAAALVYGLPLAGVLVGAALGVAVGGSDLSGLAGAAAGVAAAGLAVPRLRRRLEADTLNHLSLEAAQPHAHADPL